jgi:hypothetical protein
MVLSKKPICNYKKKRWKRQLLFLWYRKKVRAFSGLDRGGLGNYPGGTRVHPHEFSSLIPFYQIYNFFKTRQEKN